MKAEDLKKLAVEDRLTYQENLTENINNHYKQINLKIGEIEGMIKPIRNALVPSELNAQKGMIKDVDNNTKSITDLNLTVEKHRSYFSQIGAVLLILIALISGIMIKVLNS